MNNIVVIIALALFAIAATASMIALFHYCFSATLRPEYFFKFKRNIQSWEDLYTALVCLGAYIMGFSGFQASLFWIPNYADGHFYLFKNALSAALAFFAVALVAYLERSAAQSLELKLLKAQAKEYSHVIEAMELKRLKTKVGNDISI